MKAYKKVLIFCDSLAIISFFVAFIVNQILNAHISNLLLGFSFGLSLVAYYLIIKNDSTNINLKSQLFVVYSIIFIFFSLAIISPYTIKLNNRLIFLETVCIAVPTVSLFFDFILSIDFWTRVKTFFVNYSYIIVLCIIIVVCSVETLDDWMHMDSLTYYTYTSNAKSIDFSFNTLNLFKLGGHSSYAVAFFYLIGEFITPDSPVGVRCVQLALFLITIFMFSYLVKYFELDEKNKFINCVICAIYAFQPLLLGTIYNINIDYMMMVFWIFAVFFYVREEYILLAISLVCLVFSKEVGIVILCGILLGIFIIEVKKGFNIGSVKKLFFVGIPAAFFVVVWLFGGSHWFASKNPTQISSSGTELHKFGINAVNIVCKLKELFLLNFSWIFTFCICICSIVLLLKKKKIHEINNNIWILLCSYLTFIIFNFIYITYTHTRYIAPHLWIYIILFVVMINSVKIKKVLKYIIFSICCIACFIQSFITVDPVTLSVFRNIDIGTRKIVSTIAYTQVKDVITTDEEMIREREFSHAIEYNREYTYMVEALEKMLVNINYSNEDLVLIESIYGKSSKELTGIFILGKENVNSSEYYYDAFAGKIRYSDKYEKLNYMFINDESDLEDINKDNYRNIYIVSFPYNVCYEEFSAVEQVPFYCEYSINYKGWQVDARKIK